ncbi:hypothetical protein L0666_07275 [Octadecabacter sp. CECT 8868]|uniref:hypothetical protein n=1 Tax=Octadecabacter algicola TaxID=2909342 RepID=UPI001F26FAA4|nr:hypothetical protein [Octadecabacter algicola]MCF2904784.1 hypothetical protein [Octadecabacter algicola]
MSTDAGVTHVFREKSWEPVVKIQADTLIYHMPVANGHFDKHFEFSISVDEFEVLKADEERRYFLYALLHSKYQSRLMSETLRTDDFFHDILFGHKERIEQLLSLHDAESNFAVSNLVHILMNREQQPMIEGRWFNAH